jgi:hypothetical protein
MDGGEQKNEKKVKGTEFKKENLSLDERILFFMLLILLPPIVCIFCRLSLTCTENEGLRERGALRVRA